MTAASLCTVEKCWSYLVPEAAVRVATLGAKEAKGPDAVVDAPGFLRHLETLRFRVFRHL